MSANSTITVDLNESRASKVATVIILLPALAAIFVALRVYARFVLGKKRFLEDYFSILAMVSEYDPTKIKAFKVFTLQIDLLDSNVRLYGHMYVFPVHHIHGNENGSLTELMLQRFSMVLGAIFKQSLQQRSLRNSR